MSVLDPEKHRRLIEDLDEIARNAGVPRRYIEESMREICDPSEVEWVRNYPTHAQRGVFGFCYEGRDHAQQMMAMTGALTRNFVLAQLIPLGTLIDLLKAGEAPQCSVLLVPSFHTPSKNGTGMTPYQINLLWQLLEERLFSERQTVIGVHSLQSIAQDYGQHFKQLIENHYEVLA